MGIPAYFIICPQIRSSRSAFSSRYPRPLQENGKSRLSTTSSGALEGLGKGVPSLVISLCRYVVFILPLAAVLCGRLGPDGVWHAFWITEVLTALVAYPVYHRAAARH